MMLLVMFTARDSQNSELGQTIHYSQSLKMRSLKLNCLCLRKTKAAECAIASVLPRCEANNVLDDRVRMLELENSNLNEIIKKFTSNQQSLNCMIGRLVLIQMGKV